MTEQQHPITPPPELVQQWRNAAPPLGLNREKWIATQAARWGADRRLEAVCEYIAEEGKWFATPQFRLAELRAAMRPKPPSLAEEALLAIDTAVADNRISAEIARVTRTALERLQELEEGSD